VQFNNVLPVRHAGEPFLPNQAVFHELGNDFPVFVLRVPPAPTLRAR